MPKTIVMHRNKKGQFVRGRASNPRRHHKKRKHNFVSAGARIPLMNRKHHGGRRRKHNPTVPLPGIGTVDFPINTILGVTAGIALPPITQGILVSTFGMAATAAQYPTLVMIGSNVAVLAGAYFGFGRTAARDVLIGEVSSFLVKQIQSLAATTGAALQRPVYAGGRVLNMASYTQPVPRGRLGGYTQPVRSLGWGPRRGTLAAINAVRRGSRMQSRFMQS